MGKEVVTVLVYNAPYRTLIVGRPRDYVVILAYDGTDIRQRFRIAGVMEGANRGRY